MAKVVGPLHASEARGKMGGLVYNSWRGFATVKAKHAPAQPRSIKQLAVRAVAVFCSRAWGTLTNQADWNAYAVTHTLVDWTNSPKRLTGANWFVALSTRLLRLGIPEVDTPPTTPAPDAVTGITATGSAGAILVDWTTPSDHTNSVELWLDGPHTAGRQGSLIKSLYNCAPWGDEGGLSISGLQAGTYDVYARVLDRSNGLVSPFVGAVATVSQGRKTVAVVTWPLSSGEARGRVGDLIYNTHRGTSYVKTHVVHQSEFTDPQIAARAVTTAVTQAWHDLKDADRPPWNAFALKHTLNHWTGQPKRLSGYNWYVRLNWMPQYLSIYPATYPPPHLASYIFADLNAVATGLTADLTWTPQVTPGDPDCQVCFRVEGPHPPGILPSIKRARTLNLAYESAGAASYTVPLDGFYTFHIWYQSLIFGPMPPTWITLGLPQMAKILLNNLPYWENWNATSNHIGAYARSPGHPWHCVYWYFGDHTPFINTNMILTFKTEREASIAAKSLVSLPALLRHSCPFCWDEDWYRQHTPATPAWNIYRGQQHEICVPGILWDIYNYDPPPGFQWDGS